MYYGITILAFISKTIVHSSLQQTITPFRLDTEKKENLVYAYKTYEHVMFLSQHRDTQAIFYLLIETLYLRHFHCTAKELKNCKVCDIHKKILKYQSKHICAIVQVINYMNCGIDEC